MVSLLASLDHASREVSPYQLSGNFFDQDASRRPRKAHRFKAAIFRANETFLDRWLQAEFPKRKKDVGKGNGHQGQPVRQKAKGRETMSDLNQRIQAMHKGDIRVAWAFVLGLWFAIIFVALATWNLAPNGTARVLLLIAGATVLLFNTAAILAMLRHYREDRDFMYGLDIKFLDEARAARR
jgi:hypothetical protein